MVFSLSRSLLAFIFFLMLSACNKTTTKETPAADNTVKTEKIATTVYPHEKDFYKNHGANYLANKEQCLNCHGADGSGGTSNVSCLQCHQAGGFPHPKNWVTADQHSVQYQKSPQSCASCHGDDWKGGKSKVSCTQCHENYPHPLKWASPDKHGKSYIAIAEKKQCLDCHQSTKSTSMATRCDSCHKAYPHPKGFDTGGKIHRALGESYEGKCLNCHAGLKGNMPNYQDEAEGVGCFNCHDGNLKMKWFKADEPEKTSSFKAIKKSERVPSNTKSAVKKK